MLFLLHMVQMALLKLGVESDGTVKQLYHGIEATVRLQALAGQRLTQRRRQEPQPFDMPANAQQAPAVITRHAVGLGTGDGCHVVTGVLENLQGLLCWAVAAQAVLGKAAKQRFFGAGDDAPVFL